MARRNSTAQRTRSRRPGKTVEKHFGRPTALTPRVAETILGNLMDGIAIDASCALAGIHVATFHRWMQRGEQARIMLDEHGAIPDEEERFRDFREAVMDARAQAERKATRIVMTAMDGGFVLSEEPIVDIEGQVQYDANTGQVLYKRSYKPPDGRLALAYLQRARAKDWSIAAANLNAKVEVSGPGGGPINVTHEHKQIESLAERLLAVRHEFEAEDALDAEEERDVVEAEVVEDD